MTSRATPRPFMMITIQISGSDHGRTLKSLSPSASKYLQGPKGMPDKEATLMMPPEINAIMSAVMKTFCNGKRRPNARSEVKVADKSKGPSVQRRSNGESKPRQRNTKAPAQKSRNRMNIGLCHRSMAGDGLGTEIAPATLPEEDNSAAPLPNTVIQAS